jgi:hypothetical protein
MQYDEENSVKNYPEGSKTRNDDSTERAKELTIYHFGRYNEVIEMAKPIRQAKNIKEAENILKDIKNKGDIEAPKAGIKANLSNNSISEILNAEAVRNSFSTKAHIQAAANLDKLFPNAIELPSMKQNPELADPNYDIKRLYAPMLYEDRIVPVKFTVKAMKQKGEGNRIYSLEAIDVELGHKKGDASNLAPGAVLANSSDCPETSLNSNITPLFDSVNDYLSKYRV